MVLVMAVWWWAMEASAQEPGRSKLDPLPGDTEDDTSSDDGAEPAPEPEPEPDGPKLPWINAFGSYDPEVGGTGTGWTAGAEVAAGRGAAVGVSYGQTTVGGATLTRVELPLTYSLFGTGGRSFSVGLSALASPTIAPADGGTGFGALLGGELGLGLPGPLFASARGGYLLASDDGPLGPLVGPSVRLGGGISVTGLIREIGG